MRTDFSPGDRDSHHLLQTYENELRSLWRDFAGTETALRLGQVPDARSEASQDEWEGRILSRFDALGISSGCADSLPLGRYRHPGGREGQRREEWILSRSWILDCVDELRARGAPLDEIRVSLSHAGRSLLVVAARVRVAHPGGSSWAAAGIGVDLELRERGLHPRVLDRLTLPSERVRFPALEGLDFWVMKEAAYKANPFSEGSLVSHYMLVDFDPTTGVGGLRSSRIPFSIHVLLWNVGGWKGAFAKAFPESESDGEERA